MFRRIHGLLLAILFFAGSTNFASAQDALAIGAVDYGDSQVALVSGTIDDAVEPSLYYFEATDEFGLPQFGFVDIDSYGNFSLLADSSIVQHSFTTLEAVLIDPASGNAAGSLLVVVVVDFNEWFDTWDKNPDGLTEAPEGRPCIYKYSYLQENYEDVDMVDGDYFPNWPNQTWTWEKNKDFFDILVADGGPIRDTYVDENGNRIEPDGIDYSTPIEDDEHDIIGERKIIFQAGYTWDPTIPGWKKD
jgi:hypothetical protein